MGSLIVCSGFAQGMMISRLVDRPCGVGFVDLSKFNKFLTCGVDDSRDVIDHGEYMSFEFTTKAPPPTMALITPPNITYTTQEEEEEQVEKKEVDKEMEAEEAESKEKEEEDAGDK